jgi:hypothetical protein
MYCSQVSGIICTAPSQRNAVIDMDAAGQIVLRYERLAAQFAHGALADDRRPQLTPPSC